MDKDAVISTVLPEKYRPQKLDDIILPSRLHKKFEDIITSKEIPNMLFYSSCPGVGKTTTAKVLANACGYEYEYINNSLHRGIDLLRNKISRFATNLPPVFNGDTKQYKRLVILDEFDGTTRDFQDAMRAFTEQYHDTCRFICCCNYLNKIIDPLKSRLELINFNFHDIKTKRELVPQIGIRLKKILDNENIGYASLDIIMDLVNKSYPDIRSMIKLINDSRSQYGMLSNEILTTGTVNKEFYDLLLTKKFTKARKYILDNNINYTDIYGLIMENLLNNNRVTDKSVRGELYTILATYSYQSVMAPNKELMFNGCMMEMFRIL